MSGGEPKTSAKVRPASNQSQRTYAPKPTYAVKYWKSHNLQPEPVDLLGIIKRRAERYYAEQRQATGFVIRDDSRDEASYQHIDHGIRWVITSPPYYGMRTYVPDRWLRMWFVGGPPEVQYSMEGQVEYTSPELFAKQLGQVWKNVGVVCVPGAQMIIRFGGINNREADHLPILDDSLQGLGWAIEKIESAGSPRRGADKHNT
jgi:hypothetical protein